MANVLDARIGIITRLITLAFCICCVSEASAASKCAKKETDSISSLLQLKTDVRKNKKDVQASSEKDPFPAGWFGNFDEGESTYTDEGVDASQDYPAHSVLNGRSPSSPMMAAEKFEELPNRFFHESASGGDHHPWQTHYPSASFHGSDSNPWRETPEGWVQDYREMAIQDSPGGHHADWFDNSVHQLDGFGRDMEPSHSDARFIADKDLGPWEEKSVNTTISCKTEGCTAKSSLQLFNGFKEVGRRCKLFIGVHATDYDDDFSREHVEFWKVNSYMVSRQCNPRSRGCNSTATRPLYPCVNDLHIDKLIDEKGTIVLEAKNTRMVDECPYKGNLLSGVAIATCMVRKKFPPSHYTTTTTTTLTFGLDAMHGDALMSCKTPGCSAETRVHFNPVLALNGGKCTMKVVVNQTDFDHKKSEQIEWIKVEDKKVTKKALSPGKNPCDMRYMGKKVTLKDSTFVAVKSYDVTKLALKSRPMGALKVAGKISDMVDECAFNGNLFNAVVTVTCTPPKKFVVPPPSLSVTKINTANAENQKAPKP